MPTTHTQSKCVVLVSAGRLSCCLVLVRTQHSLTTVCHSAAARLPGRYEALFYLFQFMRNMYEPSPLPPQTYHPPTSPQCWPDNRWSHIPPGVSPSPLSPHHTPLTCWSTRLSRPQTCWCNQRQTDRHLLALMKHYLSLQTGGVEAGGGEGEGGLRAPQAYHTHCSAFKHTRTH